MKEKLNFKKQQFLYLKNYLINNYGVGINSSIFLHKRLEWPIFFKINKKHSKVILLTLFFKKYFLKNKVNRTLSALNILILDFIWSYRGIRHMRGLPVRGQRTWSNSWSTNRANKYLRAIRLKWAIKYYNIVTKRDAKIGLFAEFHNLLWKKQWYSSWLYAKSKRFSILKKKGLQTNELQNLDIRMMASGQIFIPALKRDLTKKQKSLQDKSLGLLGYNLGFSKLYFRTMIKRKNIRSKFNEKRSFLFPFQKIK